MTKRITPGQIKKNNRQQIYNYIYEERKVSQQDIAYALHLSRPTVASNLAELEEDGLICKSGQIETDQIGRKAVAYAIVTDYRVAVGVEILRARVKMIAVDLYGEKLSREVHQLRIQQQTDYYERVCERDEPLYRRAERAGSASWAWASPPRAWPPGRAAASSTARSWTAPA